MTILLGSIVLTAWAQWMDDSAAAETQVQRQAYRARTQPAYDRVKRLEHSKEKLRSQWRRRAFRDMVHCGLGSASRKTC